MNHVKVFLLMVLLGGAGGVLGSIAGNALGRGGLIAGAVVGGLLLVVAAGMLSARWGWVSQGQRVWTIIGGAAGFILACVVTLSTLSSPVGPVVSTLLVGSGAVLGAIVGRDRHAQP